MCGITGFVDLARTHPAAWLERTVKAMADTLLHRGPDEGGTWVDEDAGVALGHRRLSIVDLSAAGRQPMASASGRFIVSYNGEIYNAGDIRAGLGAITAPILAIQGDGDEYGTVAQVNAIASATRGCRVAVLRDCGHSPPRDQPEIVLSLITSFFEAHGF